MWTLRTKKDDTKILFKDYQTEILRKLFTTDEPLTSSKTHNHLIEIMNGDHPSRASVIFFLNDLVDYKYVKFNDVTGKGGHHREYYTNLTKNDFTNKVHKVINNSLSNALSGLFN